MKCAPSLKKANARSGFTLFVAVIVSSMLLAIGLSLGNIILKQLIFSSTGKESQIAFYAADSGAECALYWDRKDIAGLTTFEGVFASTTTDVDILDGIKCGFGGGTGQIGGFLKDDFSIPNVVRTTFSVNYTRPGSDPSCAFVTVTKTVDDSDPDDVRVYTHIDSRGYNAPFTGSVGYSGPATPSSGSCNLTNPRVVERAIVLSY